LRFDVCIAWQGARHIEFKDSADPHDGVISVFRFCEFQRRRSIDEQAAASPTSLLDDPVSRAVPADHENRRLQA
jgi:hypothetical protein